MATVIGIDKIFYSASSIVQVFNNAITVPEAKRLIQVKGIYLHGRGVNYGGSYYDQLKDEASDACLTLIVPALIRNTLVQNKTIEFNAFVTRKVVANGGRIELQLTVCDLLNQTTNKFSDEEIRAIEIQQRKANQGFRDLDAVLKKKLIAGEAINVVVLIGKNAIIDADIKHQLEESIAAFSISFERINLSSVVEIFSTINRFDRDGVDVLVISRAVVRASRCSTVVRLPKDP